jgi:hypothetical protein
MSVLGKEEFFNRVKEHIGNDTSDESIAFIEDITDTYNELEQRSKDETDWKSKYEELDENWKKRYRDRFFDENANSPETTPSIAKKKQKENVESDGEKRDFEDLFEEREG